MVKIINTIILIINIFLLVEQIYLHRNYFFGAKNQDKKIITDQQCLNYIYVIGYKDGIKAAIRSVQVAELDSGKIEVHVGRNTGIQLTKDSIEFSNRLKFIFK